MVRAFFLTAWALVLKISFNIHGDALSFKKHGLVESRCNSQDLLQRTSFLSHMATTRWVLKQVHSLKPITIETFAHNLRAQFKLTSHTIRAKLAQNDNSQIFRKSRAQTTHKYRIRGYEMKSNNRKRTKPRTCFPQKHGTFFSKKICVHPWVRTIFF